MNKLDFLSSENPILCMNSTTSPNVSFDTYTYLQSLNSPLFAQISQMCISYVLKTYGSLKDLVLRLDHEERETLVYQAFCALNIHKYCTTYAYIELLHPPFLQMQRRFLRWRYVWCFLFAFLGSIKVSNAFFNSTKSVQFLISFFVMLRS